LLSLGAETFFFSSPSKNINIKIYTTVVLPVVLYGCETWCVTLWEEQRLSVFKNGLLRNIWALEEWRKLHNEELCHMSSSTNIILAIKSRRIRWAGHVACMEERRCVYRVLVGKPEGQNHLEDLGVDRRIILKWIFKK